MKMTFSMVLERLVSQLHTQPLFLRRASAAPVAGVSLRSGGPYRDDWIYVLDSAACLADPAEYPECCVILSEAEHAEACFRHAGGGSVAVFAVGESRADFLDRIQEAFDFCGTWYDNLLNMIREDGSWFSLLDEAHRVLCNPIILYDRSMKVLAFTRNDGTDDAIWNDTVSSGTARVETATEAEELLRYVSRLDESTGPFRHIGQGMSDPFINCNVMYRSVRCGMVTVIEHHASLTQGQLDFLQAFADLISIRFRSEDASRLSQEAADSQLIRDLVTGGILSRDRLNTRLIATQWKYSRYFQLLLFVSEFSFMNDMQWKQNYDDLVRCGMNGIGGIMRREETGICYLISFPHARQGRASVDILQSFCTSHRLRCGVSNVFEDLLDAPHYLSQAAAALALASDRVVPYERFRLLRMIRYLNTADYPEDLMHPAVLQLDALDRSDATDYLNTIRCFLKHGMNQTETAEDLGIHRTTLIYRLRRITELTGLVFSDSRAMLHVAVSIEMLRTD